MRLSGMMCGDKPALTLENWMKKHRVVAMRRNLVEM